MQQLFIFLIIYSFTYSIMMSKYSIAIIALCVFIIWILLLPLWKKYLIARYTKLLKEAQKNISQNKEFSPFIVVNYVPWYVLDLIPGIKTHAAKKIANRVKRKKIRDFSEFANLAELEPVTYEFIKKIIII